VRVYHTATDEMEDGGGGADLETSWWQKFRKWTGSSQSHSVLVYAFLGSNKHYISSYGSIHVFVTKHETLSPLV
jgi:hypothetical protein